MTFSRTARNGSLFEAYLVVDWSANSKPKTGKEIVRFAKPATPAAQYGRVLSLPAPRAAGDQTGVTR
jgi:hypothetical protein